MNTAPSSTPHAVAIALVAEDQVLRRMETASLLEEAGFVVLEAGGAAEALDLFRSNGGIRLLDTDIQKPGDQDGLDLAREVRRAWPAVEVVVVSAQKKPRGDELPDSAAFIDKLMPLSRS